MGGGRPVQGNDEYEPIRQDLQKTREEHAKKFKPDYSHVFRQKSRLEMIRLSCIIMGIEFAYAAETAFVSPILLEIGIDHHEMTMVWAISPLIGFFLAPLMGSLSDRCGLKLGRRRPFIIILSIGILIGLFLVPYGKDIGIWLSGEDPNVIPTALMALTKDTLIQPASAKYEASPSLINIVGLTNDTNMNILKYHVSADENSKSSVNMWAVAITVIGVILLDFDADTCQTPSRAYLLDVSVTGDHSKCLSTFTFMAGLGGSLGYALGGVNWDELGGIGDIFGGNIKTVFTIVTVIFVVTVVLTLTSFREVPLPVMNKDELLRPIGQADIKKELGRRGQVAIKETEFKSGQDSEKGLKEVEDEEEEEEEIVSLGQYLKSIVFMPKSVRILCLCNLFCWMAHLCYCLYFTSFVGEEVFKGNPQAPAGSPELIAFNDGVRFGCFGMAIYAFSCSVYSYAIEHLLRYFKTKYVYIGSLLIFSVGMLFLGLFPSKWGVLVWSVSAGIIYASLFTFPYILIAQYHAKGSFKVKKGEEVVSQQKRGLGTDIAIVSSMIFVAQIIVALTIGVFINWLGSTAAVIFAAGFCGVCAAVTALFVLYIEG